MKVGWRELPVPGLFLSQGANLTDHRGSFRKIMSGPDPAFPEFQGSEVFWTRSDAGVLRGLHFQLPPDATRKLVFVAHGLIRDFVVDLRRGSPMERELFEIELGPDVGGLLIPAGCAHAYEALLDDTIVCYVQDVPFVSRDTYAGIRPDSAGIVPRSSTPIFAERDLLFPTLDQFESPFVLD